MADFQLLYSMRLPFFSTKERSLGVDIGTSSVKAVQLAATDQATELETYGEIRAELTVEGTPEPTVSLIEADLADMIREVVAAAKIRPENVTMSVPIFSSFVTTFELPLMNEQELAQAVPFQARKYVPVSLEEVSLDWSVTAQVQGPGGSEMISVLLVAIPNELIQRHVRIARLSGLEVAALEMETFALSRASVGKDRSIVCLVDIGAHSTDMAVIENGIVQVAHNIDIAGMYLTQGIARSMNVSIARAEQLKQTVGVGSTLSGVANLQELIGPYLELIIGEIGRIIVEFNTATNRKVQRILISGSGSLQAGLNSYFSQKLGLPVSSVDPFATLQYPSALSQTLKNLGPTYAVAVGLAMRQFKGFV